MNSKKLIIVLFILLGIFVVFAGCKKIGEKESKTLKSDKDIEKPVVTVKVENEVQLESKSGDIADKTDHELTDVKILKVGGYEIDTTKYDPNTKIELRKDREYVYKSPKDGEMRQGTYHEYITYSKNKEYVLRWKGVETQEIWEDLWEVEVYQGGEEKQMIQNFNLEVGKAISKGQVLSNGYIILDTVKEIASSGFLEIHNTSGEKIFSTTMENKSYLLSPDASYILIFDKKEYQVFGFDYEENKIELIEDFDYESHNIKGFSLCPWCFSDNSEYYLLPTYLDENTYHLNLISENRIVWQRIFTNSELGLDKKNPFFSVTNNGKYVFFGNGFINIETNEITNKEITKIERKRYEEE
ncbi:hypothetical protein KAI78_06460 [bacterium]|nr:hypothetical protein [bacterium]